MRSHHLSLTNYIRSCTTRRHQIGSLNHRPAVSVWGWRGAETTFSTSTKRGCTADACLANRSVAVSIPRKAHHKNPHSCSVVFRWLDYDGGRQCLLLRKRKLKYYTLYHKWSLFVRIEVNNGKPRHEM